MLPRSFLATVCLASAVSAGPALTTIQDVLYKADGTRFNGTLTISWHSFESADDSAVITQSTTVRVLDGNLRVQLVPGALRLRRIRSCTTVTAVCSFGRPGRFRPASSPCGSARSG